MNNTLSWWSFRLMLAGYTVIAMEFSFFHNIRPIAIAMACAGFIGLVIAKRRFGGSLKSYMPELLTKGPVKPDPKRQCFCPVCNCRCKMAEMTMWPMGIGAVLAALGVLIGIWPFLVLALFFAGEFIAWMAVTNWYAIATYYDCTLAAKLYGHGLPSSNN